MLVRGVREWYGEIPLFVDANADYSMEDIDIFRELDAYGLMMLEQPFRRADLTGASELQRSVRTPVCFDEGIETVVDVQEAAVADACRIVNIKLQRVGGFLEAFRIAEACAQHNMPAWMGTMPELGIGSAQALVFAAHPQCLLPTDVEPSNRWYQDDILRQSIKLDGNAIIVPKGPGLGYQVDASALERYSVRHVRL